MTSLPLHFEAQQAGLLGSQAETGRGEAVGCGELIRRSLLLSLLALGSFSRMFEKAVQQENAGARHL